MRRELQAMVRECEAGFASQVENPGASARGCYADMTQPISYQGG
jgi:hypothetical protein